MVLREDSASYQTGGAGDGEGDGVTEGVVGGAAGVVGADPPLPPSVVGGSVLSGFGVSSGFSPESVGCAMFGSASSGPAPATDPPPRPFDSGGSAIVLVSSTAITATTQHSATTVSGRNPRAPSRSRAWRACLVTWPAWPPAGRSWWLSANGPPPRATESSDDSTPSSAILKLWRRGELVVSWRNRRRNVRSRG